MNKHLLESDMRSTIIEFLLTLAFMGDAQVAEFPPQEVMCLAQNVYHEARGENLTGRRAVAHVTLNRVADRRWPGTVCEVVYQPYQFSWTLGDPPVNEPGAFEASLMVAVNAMRGLSPDPTEGSTFFFDHNRVTPRWSRSFETVAVIGGHTFQR